jgi:hypothetical protein
VTVDLGAAEGPQKLWVNGAKSCILDISFFYYKSDDSDNEQDECENERTVFFMPRNKRFIPLHKKTTLFSHFHNYHYMYMYIDYMKNSQLLTL